MQCKARLNLITGHERVVASTRKKDPSSARATYYLAASRILPTRFSRVTGYCCKRQWPSDACNRFWASLDHRCRQSAPALFFLAPLSNATERLATKRLRQVYVRERNCWQSFFLFFQLSRILLVQSVRRSFETSSHLLDLQHLIGMFDHFVDIISIHCRQGSIRCLGNFEKLLFPKFREFYFSDQLKVVVRSTASDQHLNPFVNIILVESV